MNISSSTPAGTPILLASGLSLTLSSGFLKNDENFSVDLDGSDGSFSTSNPSFSVGSTSAPTVGGSFDGAADDTLTLQVRQAGVIGSDLVQIDVFDGQSNLIETVDFDPANPAGTPVSLQNGLTLAFSDGELSLGDLFTVDVTAETEESVDPDQPFDGSGGAGPNFEGGLQVTAGAFKINGVSIAVNADDSLNDVLDRINASEAGVTATFDSDTETVRLTRNTSGSQASITLSEDTSGFLAATKLDGATATPGEDTDLDKTLSSVAAFSGISAGNFSINGVSVSVDPAVDSLSDVLARINASSANVTAEYLEGEDVVRIRSDGGSAVDLTLADETSGFFSAIGVAEGALEGSAGQKGNKSVLTSGKSVDRLDRLTTKLNEFFEAAKSASSSSTTERLQAAVQATFENVLGKKLSSDATQSGLGIDLTSSASSSTTLVDLNADTFREAVSGNFDRLTDFLLRDRGENGSRGLLPELEQALKEIEEGLLDSLDGGTTLDLLA